MNSRERSDPREVDFARDAPTTADDVSVLRALSHAPASWFLLSPEEIDALIPEGALAARPPIRADASPFTLP